MERKGRNAKAGTYIVDGWQYYVPALPAFKSGRQEFKLVYDNGRLIESVEVPASSSRPAASGAPAGWLTMAQAAAKCRCSLYWFSRNWRGWGLHPSRLGRLLFDESEIENMLKGKRLVRRGRPSKVRGLRA